MGIAAVLVGQGDVISAGAKPPEELFDPKQFIGELADREIIIEGEQIE
jgi:saccharopine dehydrogenase (NAD+, L-lysine-forming)